MPYVSLYEQAQRVGSEEVDTISGYVWTLYYKKFSGFLKAPAGPDKKNLFMWNANGRKVRQHSRA